MHWLRHYRQRSHLTQEQLAAKLALEGLEYTAGAIGHWERERYAPPLDDPEFRTALAKIFRVSEADILSAAGYDLHRPPHTPEGERIAALVDRVPAAKRSMILDVVERMIAG